MIKKVLFSVLLVIASSVSAEEIIGSEQEIGEIAAQVAFEALDMNKDGAIDATEAEEDVDLAFDFPSVATNGMLDLAGFAAWKASLDSAE